MIRQFGVVRFDDADPNAGGWVSVGGEAAYRIAGVGALDNRTLWWTNLSFHDMVSSNLHKARHIKRSTYLASWVVEGMADVAQHWGLLPRIYKESTITEVLSGIFSRVMTFVVRAYRLDLNDVPLADNLADEIRTLVVPRKDPAISTEVNAALRAAHQHAVHCITPRVRQDQFSTVRFGLPGPDHASYLLHGTDYPSNQCELVAGAQLPADPAKRVDWALTCELPILAHVTVQDVDADIAPIIAYANGATNNRAWVSQIELYLLAQYARVEIDTLFVFGEYLSPASAWAPPQFTELQAMTPTADIVAHNHWVGLQRENPYSLEMAAAKQRTLSPRAVWLNAMDRFRMFTFALQLHREGLIVKRYGVGSVYLMVPKGAYRDAYEVASSVGLVGPTALVNDVLMQEELHGYV